jgi:hypothetical protein
MARAIWWACSAVLCRVRVSGKGGDAIGDVHGDLVVVVDGGGEVGFDGVVAAQVDAEEVAPGEDTDEPAGVVHDA